MVITWGYGPLKVTQFSVLPKGWKICIFGIAPSREVRESVNIAQSQIRGSIILALFIVLLIKGYITFPHSPSYQSHSLGVLIFYSVYYKFDVDEWNKISETFPSVILC